jgi:hypothetical protein
MVGELSGVLRPHEIDRGEALEAFNALVLSVFDPIPFRASVSRPGATSASSSGGYD